MLQIFYHYNSSGLGHRVECAVTVPWATIDKTLSQCYRSHNLQCSLNEQAKQVRPQSWLLDIAQHFQPLVLESLSLQCAVFYKRVVHYMYLSTLGAQNCPIKLPVLA